MRRRVRRQTGPSGRPLLHHVVASMLALVVVGLVAILITRVVAGDETEQDARLTTRTFADGYIAPLITERLRAGDPAAIGELDHLVGNRIKAGRIKRVKVWAEDGTVLFSDDQTLIGRRFPLEAEDRETLRTGGVESDVSQTDRVENVAERQLGPLLEVYAGARDTLGRPILVEAYFSLNELHERRSDLMVRIIPLVLIPLVLLELMLIPLAVRLARRVEGYEQDRQGLVRIAADAAAIERRRVAGQLHDGVIQDLSGVGYALAAVDRKLGDLGEQELRGTVQTTLGVIRGDLVALRNMITTMYASDLGDADLADALSLVARELELRGMTVDLDVSVSSRLPEPVAGAAFQVAREAMRNVASHARASRASVRLAADADRLELVVRDDGVGFEPADVAGPVSGHLGLSLLHDAAERIGADLRIESGEQAGTTVTMVLELDGTARPQPVMPGGGPSLEVLAVPGQQQRGA